MTLREMIRPMLIIYLISYPGPDLLRDPEGAADEAGGLDEAERLPRLHHLLQARHPGPVELPAQAVVLLHPRRGAAHQELQEPALAAPAQLQQQGAPPVDRHASAGTQFKKKNFSLSLKNSLRCLLYSVLCVNYK